MPTINKPKRKNTQKHGKAKEIWKLYNTSRWRKLRDAKLMENPLCEICEQSGITKQATQVHHITPISTGSNELEMMDLAYNYNNLQSLCDECHQRLHKDNR